MWLKPRISKRRLTRLEISTSTLSYCLKPLLKAGFRPSWFVVLIPTGLHKPIVGFHFYNPKTKHRMVFVFGRAQPFYFVHTSPKRVVRSNLYDSLEDFEAALARYLKIPKFSPEKRPVCSWPPKAMRSVIHG